jgi:hypothetical protein
MTIPMVIKLNLLDLVQGIVFSYDIVVDQQLGKVIELLKMIASLMVEAFVIAQ